MTHGVALRFASIALMLFTRRPRDADGAPMQCATPPAQRYAY